MPTTAVILTDMCAFMYLIPRLGRIQGPGIHKLKFPEEPTLVPALLGQGFSFLCLVT